VCAVVHAGRGRRIVLERDPERTTFAGVERIHVAGHASGDHPGRDRARIEKRAINNRAGRVHAATDAGRTHARTLARAARRATRRQDLARRSCQRNLTFK